MSAARPPYRRVQAPIYHRPTSWFSHGLRRIGSVEPQGGVRSYSDDPVKVGRLLEMDVFLPDGETVTAVVEVEWCDPLPRGGPALFDVGMQDRPDRSGREGPARERAGARLDAAHCFPPVPSRYSFDRVATDSTFHRPPSRTSP